MAESCKLRGLHVEPGLFYPPNLSLQIFWTNFPRKFLRDLKGFILFITWKAIQVLGQNLPSKKHQQILQLLSVLMWELDKPKFLERNLLQECEVQCSLSHLSSSSAVGINYYKCENNWVFQFAGQTRKYNKASEVLSKQRFPWQIRLIFRIQI